MFRVELYDMDPVLGSIPAWSDAAQCRNVFVDPKILEIGESDSWAEKDTPRKINIEPENGPLEKEIPFGNHPF